MGHTWSASAITVSGESPPVPSVVSYSSFSREGPSTSMTSTARGSDAGARGSETGVCDPKVVGGRGDSWAPSILALPPSEGGTALGPDDPPE